VTKSEIKLKSEIEDSKIKIAPRICENYELEGCKVSLEAYVIKEETLDDDGDEIYTLIGLDETMIRDEFESIYKIKWSRNYSDIFDAWEYSHDFLEKYGYLNIEVEKLTLEKLNIIDDFDLLRDIAGNKKTPIFILEKLANNENKFIRQSVAYNTKCPTHLLELLSKCSHSWTRQNVASNLGTPVKVLESLMYDKSEDVREILSKNQNLPKKSLIELEEYEKELSDKLHNKLDKLFNGFRDEEIDSKWLGDLLRDKMSEEGKDLNVYCKNMLNNYGIFQSRLEVDSVMYYKVYYKNDNGDLDLNDTTIFKDDEQDSHDIFNKGIEKLLIRTQKLIDDSDCEKEK